MCRYRDCAGVGYESYVLDLAVHSLLPQWVAVPRCADDDDVLLLFQVWRQSVGDGYSVQAKEK